MGDPWRDEFHIIHVSRWALVPRAVIPEPFLSPEFTPRNVNSDLQLHRSYKRLPCFWCRAGKGRGDSSWQAGGGAGAHREGQRAGEALVCSGTLEGEGWGRAQPRMAVSGDSAARPVRKR